MSDRRSSELSIRPPLFGRVWSVVFGGFFTIFAGTLLIRSLVDGLLGGAAASAVFVAGAVYITAHNLRLGVHTDGDTLIVRNGVRARRFQRHEIARFHLLDQGPTGSGVALRETGGPSTALRATQTGPFKMGRATAEGRLAALEAWRTQG